MVAQHSEAATVGRRILVEAQCEAEGPEKLMIVDPLHVEGRERRSDLHIGKPLASSEECRVGPLFPRLVDQRILQFLQFSFEIMIINRT